MNGEQNQSARAGQGAGEELEQLKARARELPGVADLLRLHEQLAETKRVASTYQVRGSRAVAFSSSDHTS